MATKRRSSRNANDRFSDGKVHISLQSWNQQLCDAGRSDSSVSWIDHDSASDETSGDSAEALEEPNEPADNPFQTSTTAALGETLMGSVENLAQSSKFGEEEQPSGASTSIGPDSNSSSDESSSEDDEPAPSLANSSESSSEDSDEDARDSEVSWAEEAEALSRRFGNADDTPQSRGGESREVDFCLHDAIEAVRSAFISLA